MAKEIEQGEKKIGVNAKIVNEMQENLPPEALENKKIFLSKIERNYVRCWMPDKSGIEIAEELGIHPGTVYKIASRSQVKEALRRKYADLIEKSQISQARILAEEARIATADIREIFSEDGTIIPMKDLPADIAACIAGIEMTCTRDENGNPETKFKYRFWDKGQALNRLEKCFAMQTEKKEVQIDGLAEALDRAIHRTNKYSEPEENSENEENGPEMAEDDTD